MSQTADIAQANQRLLKKLSFVAVLMFGFGYAMVPFYEQICRITGVRNVFAPDQGLAVNTQVDFSRRVGIEFDANTQRLAWTFKPLQSGLTIHPGEVMQVEYEIRNTLDRAVTGQAVPSYGPQNAAQYFRKLECFCFTQQTLAPGEARRMPVVFVVDPSLPKDINTITLSYTFFEVNAAKNGPG